MTTLTREENDPLKELARENDVLRSLDERLAELALALREGGDVAVGELGDGLRLYEQYLGLHARRFGDGLGPEARPVAMSTCFEHLDALVRDRGEAGGRLGRARAALATYAREAAPGREGLARELEALTEHESDELRYENDYPLACLLSALPDDAAGRVVQGFAETRAELDDLDRHVQDYLARPPGHATVALVVRCHDPGCRARGEAESYPDERGHLALRAPRGWTAVPHDPRLVDGTRVTVEVDYYCPTHVPDAAVVAGPRRVGTPEEVGEGPCCDPVPPKLA